MRFTDKVENENHYCLASFNYSGDLSRYNIESAIAIDKSIDKLGLYEDIDDNPEHLAEVNKAFKIVKNKKVQVAILQLCNSCVGYNMTRGLLGEDLTQEEFDLLKRVLL